MGIFTAATALITNGGGVQQEPLTDRPAQDAAETKSATILVIDDDSMVLQTVKTLLGKRGYNVLTSASAPKGLDMLRYAAGEIRAVVLDYSMPQLNGDATLNFIRQISPNVKTIGLTAMKLDSVPKAYRDGVDKLLAKPVNAAELIGAVHEVLGDAPVASSEIQP